MVKRILFLLNQAPYASSYALETLESILVAGVFEQEVSLLFKGTGLHQLLRGQEGAALGRRTIAKVLSAFPDYGLERFFACRSSMERLHLTASDFCLPVTLLGYAEQQRLINQQDIITG